MSRSLVITADDLGRDSAGTATILSLHAAGAITRTTLIPVTPHSRDAAETLRRGGLSPQLHLTLSSDTGPGPWRPLSTGSTLRDAAGHLPADPALVESRAAVHEVREEMDTQLHWMHEAGLRPVSADSHSGVLYGLRGGEALLPSVLAWCAEHRLAFRLPRRPQDVPGSDSAAGDRARHRAAVELADQLGVRLPAAVLTHRRGASLPGGYDALREELIAGLRELPEGTSELVLHPSGPGPGIPEVRTWEARLLQDPQWRQALREEDLDLVQQW